MKRTALFVVVLLLLGCTSEPKVPLTDSGSPVPQSQGNSQTRADESKHEPTASGGTQSSLNDQEKQALNRLQSYSWDAQELWTKFQFESNPSESDFSGLEAATGVTILDGHSDPVKMGSDRVKRAVRLLSTTFQLGPGNPPAPELIDYKLDFVGLTPSVVVTVAKNAAYFRGQVYYCPELADWLKLTLQADDGR